MLFCLMKGTNERKTKVIIEKEKFVKNNKFQQEKKEEKMLLRQKSQLQILRKFPACIKIIPVLYLKVLIYSLSWFNGWRCRHYH